jgi:glycosyltransferase involved in cell wall biosynthesis
MKSKLEHMGFKGKIVYLPNFVNVDEFLPQYDWKDKTIVYFGRLSEEKGLLTLLSAMGKVNGAYLKIIGEGPMRPELEKKIRLGNLENVQLLGYKSGNALRDEISSCMFTVFPSECLENYPRAILESFALGKPVIGSDIGGIPELVINNQTGLKFTPFNPDELTANIKYLLSRPDKIREMGVMARSFVDENSRPEKHYDSLMKIYEQALAQHQVLRHRRNTWC